MTPLIAGNWKLNGLAAAARDLADGIRKGLEGYKGPEVLVCPTFTALHVVRETLAGSPILLGAQDVYWEPKGAFTGQISPGMLLDAGCTHVIIGHSERRHIMGETHEMVNRKTRAALDAGLVPIVCVGELLEEREAGSTEKVVKEQIDKGFDGFTAGDLARLVIAYEPVWAIGTGKTATPAQAQEVHAYIRKLLAGRTGDAASIRILYGGSVKPDNAKELMAQGDVNGALIGGASLKVDSFVKIARYQE